MSMGQAILLTSKQHSDEHGCRRKETDPGSLNPLLFLLVPSTRLPPRNCAYEDCWVRWAWLLALVWPPEHPLAQLVQDHWPLLSFAALLVVSSSFSSQWSPWQWELPRHLGRKCFIPSILVTGPTGGGPSGGALIRATAQAPD